MAKKKTAIDYSYELTERFTCWDNIRKNGCGDPFWPDGVNMNLVRNHIIYYKQKIEENDSEGNYPAIYFRETPPKVKDSYMARADEIRENAKKVLSLFAQDESLKLIKRKLLSMDPKFLEQVSAQNIVSYETNLKAAIEKDDLVSMRRYEHYGSYLNSIQNCADKIREYQPPANEQMSLFDCIEEREEELFGIEMEM